MSTEKRTAIVTDSNSGTGEQEKKELGIFTIPMPFSIDGEQYYEGVNLTQEGFYEKVFAGAQVLTSMPAVGDVMECWRSVLKEYDELVYLPMSSGLSSSCETAQMLSQDDEFVGKVFVVDSCRVSVPQKQLVLDAAELVGRGYDASRIKEELDQVANQSVVLIAVDSLKYLKKGGRVTAATALVGDALGIKPILRMQGEKLNLHRKPRNMKKAVPMLEELLEQEWTENLQCSAQEVHLEVAYSGLDDTLARKVKQELEEKYPGHEVRMEPLTLSLACHIGPNAVGVACSKRI